MQMLRQWDIMSCKQAFLTPGLLGGLGVEGRQHYLNYSHLRVCLINFGGT